MVPPEMAPPGLQAAPVALRGEELPARRCTVHEHRTLMDHAPDRMQDGLAGDHRDMIHADTAAGIGKRRKAFLRKWRLKCRAVAESLEEAGARPFTSARLIHRNGNRPEPPTQQSA